MNMNQEEILEKLGNEIILNAIHRCREPEIFSHRYNEFVTNLKFQTLLEFGIIDEETMKKYDKLSKGIYDNEIYQDYLDAIATEFIPLDKYFNQNK